MNESPTANRFEREVHTSRSELPPWRGALAVGAETGACVAPEPATVPGRHAGTGTPVRPSGRAGTDDYEITVTLRVGQPTSPPQGSGGRKRVMGDAARDSCVEV